MTDEEKKVTSEEVAAIIEKAERDSKIIAAHLVGIAKRAAPIALAMCIMAAAVLAGLVVFDLGYTWFVKDDAIKAGLAAGTMVVTVLVLAGIVALAPTTQTARGVALLFFIVWLAILGCVVALWAVLRVSANGGLLKSIPVPVQIGGEIAYSVAPAINLIPLLVVALVIARAPKDKHKSLLAASGESMWTVAKGVGFVAGFAAEMYFGLANGITPLYAVPASFVIGLGFLSAIGNYVDSQHRRDTFDQKVWLVSGGIFLAYLCIVTFEAVNTLTVQGQAAQLSQAAAAALVAEHHATIGYQIASTLYYASMPVFLAVFFVSFVLTSRIDKIKPGPVAVAPTDGGFRVATPAPPTAQLANEHPLLAGLSAEDQAAILERLIKESQDGKALEAKLIGVAKAGDTTITEMSAEDDKLLRQAAADSNISHNNKRGVRRTAAQVDADKTNQSGGDAGKA